MRFSIWQSSFVYLLLAGLILVSCSSFWMTTSTDSMTLKVAQNSNAGCFFPLYVAQQENFFRAQGLTLNPPIPPVMGNGTKVTAAVESRTIEVAGGSVITDAFTLSRVDWRVRLLGVLSAGYIVDIIVSKKFEQQAHLTVTSSLSDKVKALVGKKIGTSGPGTATEALAIYLFRIMGHDAKRDATLVNVGGTNAAPLAALRSGRVDAVSFFSPAGQQSEAQGIGTILISPDRGDIPAMRGQIHCVFYTMQDVIDAKPRAVQAFIRAMAQSEAFIHKDQANAIVLMQKYLKLDKKTTKTVFAALLPVIPESPQVDRQGYDAANQFHVKAGLIAIALPYKDLVATSTINRALSGTNSSS